MKVLEKERENASVILCWRQQKPRVCTRVEIMQESGTLLPVIFLTENACSPGSRHSPFAALKLVQRCAFLVPTQAKQLACSLAQQKTRVCTRVKIMRREGLEPSSLAACAPQTHAYTNSATCAINLF